MEKWRCVPCDYIYDPAQGDIENGIEPGTPFEDLPDDWECPICGVGKDECTAGKEHQPVSQIWQHRGGAQPAEPPRDD